MSPRLMFPRATARAARSSVSGPRRWPASAVTALVGLAGLLLAACAPMGSSVPPPGTLEPPPPRAQPTPPAERMPLDRDPNTPLSGGLTPYGQPGYGGAGASGGMVRVGLLVPLSGRAAPVGQGILNAAQMAAFDVADDRFVLQPYDTRGTPVGAAEAARAAVAQGAQVLLGPVFSGSTRAAAPVASRAGVNLVAFTTDPSVAGGHVFVMGFLVREQVARMVQFALGEGRTRFGALAPDETYGQVATLALRQQVAARGASLVDVRGYAADAADIREPARALQGAEAILIPDTGDGLRAAVNALAYVDIDADRVRYMGTMLWDDSRLWRESALAGGVFPAPPRNTIQTFAEKYRAAFGSAPPELASLGFDAVALAARLARMPGGPRFDRAMLTDAAGFSGVAGIFRFRADGTVQRGLSVMEIQSDGNVLEIAPAPLGFGGAGARF